MKTTNFIQQFGLIMALMIAVTSCGDSSGNMSTVPNPQADFSYNVDVDNNMIINFENQSENYAYFSWDFGDEQGKSTDKNPTYTFAAEDTYSVTLMATNSRGVTDVKTIDVVVKPNNPKADFSFARGDSDAMTVVFTNQSEYFSSISWDFGDGSAASTEDSPSHTYSLVGTYTVTLTATNSEGVTNSKTLDIAVPITNISGLPVPIGDIGEWKQIFYDDFTKDAAVGTWGSDCEPEKIVYTGTQGQQWRAYPKCYVDTYQKRPYRSDKVLSVKDGALFFHLHTVDGQPAGANPSPIIDPITGSQYQTYGRYTARFKVDNPNLYEYYVAWLLWPQSERWPDDGEEDFPEGGLSGNVGGFHHYAGADALNPTCYPNCQQGVHTNKKFTEWHTYTIEWRPGNIKYILDGEVILNSNVGVPTTPMRWQLQTETNGNPTGAEGNLIVDWVAVYKYAP